MLLEKEQATYTRELSKLLPSAGKFALVHGEQIVGIFEAYADALQAGYEKLGVSQPFMVKQIEVVERIQHFTRNLPVCHT
jgi:hypothetical protein